MSDESTPTRGRLRQYVAEEIRVLLARKRMSGAELGRRAGITQSTMSRRMTGETAFDMDDLERIAEVLEIEVTDLLPKPVASEEGSGFKHPYIFPDLPAALPERPAEPRGSDPLAPRPIGGGRPAATRPRSTPRRNSTRPAGARPAVLPRAS
jgi:transcriptional regulator with XRE-family HTH domain